MYMYIVYLLLHHWDVYSCYFVYLHPLVVVVDLKL